ncbi:MAG: Lrp/AsnC family transcriptional regulator [Clostridia bacterium]
MNTEKLLNLLENNANLTHSEIAVILDEKEEDVSKAVSKLESDGIIKSYNATINWEKTDVTRATALIEVCVTPQRDSGFDEIATKIMSFTEVESVYLMAGGYDLAVIVKGKTMTDVAMFVRRRLATLDGILSTATRFILTKYKDQGTALFEGYGEIDDRESLFSD